MKTDELWEWIWEDDDVLDTTTLRELLGPETDRAAGLQPPTVTTEGVWEWVASDEDLIDADLLDLEPEPQATPTQVEPSTSPSATRGVASGDVSGSHVEPLLHAPPLQERAEVVVTPSVPPPQPPPPPPAPWEVPSEAAAAPVVEPAIEPDPVAPPEPAPARPSVDPFVNLQPIVELPSEPVVEPVAEPVIELPPAPIVEPAPAPEVVVTAEPASVSEDALTVGPTAPNEIEHAPEVIPALVPLRPRTLERPPPTEPPRPRGGGALWARVVAVLAVAAVVAAVAPRVLPAVLPGDDDGTGLGAVPDQHVVAWTVRLAEAPDATFVAILAAGVKPPVIMAVPADVTINVPGQGLGTLGEAAAGGDVGLVGVALENLVSVRMDGSVDSTSGELQAAVDALGTIEVADQPMTGEQMIRYLTALEPGALPDERFLRWQDVLEGIRDGVAANPAAVAGFPEPLRPVLAAGSPEPMALYGLPVVDLGAGLLRPDAEALETLVEDLFVPHAGAEFRIVVLNGVGRPGVGEVVARILVPEGYRLVSTGNANTFGVQVTKIIAMSEDDLAAAHRARELMGVGQVLMGGAAGLADVQIVVGQDFVDEHLGGA